ncbi:MAG TPA: hypothetical protein VJW76_05665 [Verrucomicrobiae bacterium]|nr:hypothetical protein [Verrucomicrobiae bacterium]
MKSRLGTISAIVVLAFTGTTVAQDHVIKLSRPKTVGMKFHVTGHGTEREERILVVSGRTNRTENAFDLEFAAQSEVLEVDSKGHMTKAAFALQKCLKTSGQEKEELFPKGTVIVASSQGGKTVFSTKDGSPVPQAQSKVLDLVISVHHGGADDDEIFGTTTRQKVGGTWPINGDVARRDLEKKMPGFTLSAVKGSTRLLGLAKVDGIDCLNLSAELRLQASPGNLQPGMKILQNELTANFAGTFPIDSTRQPLAESQEMTLRIALAGKFGPQQLDGVARTSARRKSELRFRYSPE